MRYIIIIFFIFLSSEIFSQVIPPIVKGSDLETATTPTGSEYIIGLQGGHTKKFPWSFFSGGGGGTITSVFGRSTSAITAQSSDYASFYYPLGSNPAHYLTTVTQGMVRRLFSATSPLNYDSSTATFSLQYASSSQPGGITAANFSTFNNKENTLYFYSGLSRSGNIIRGKIVSNSDTGVVLPAQKIYWDSKQDAISFSQNKIGARISSGSGPLEQLSLSSQFSIISGVFTYVGTSASDVTFNGRSGPNITPMTGDYTYNMVGAYPMSGNPSNFELQSNKATNMSVIDNVKYVTTALLKNQIDSLHAAGVIFTCSPPLRFGSGGSGLVALIDMSGHPIVDPFGNQLYGYEAGTNLQIDSANTTRAGSFSPSDYYLLHHLPSAYYPLSNPLNFIPSSGTPSPHPVSGFIDFTNNKGIRSKDTPANYITLHDTTYLNTSGIGAFSPNTIDLVQGDKTFTSDYSWLSLIDGQFSSTVQDVIGNSVLYQTSLNIQYTTGVGTTTFDGSSINVPGGITIDHTSISPSTSASISLQTPNASGTLALVSQLDKVLNTKGDLYGFSTVPVRIPVGANGAIPTADNTAAAGISYKTIAQNLGYTPASTTQLANYLPLPGGTMTGDIQFSSGNLLKASASQYINISDAGKITFLNNDLNAQIGPNSTFGAGGYSAFVLNTGSTNYGGYGPMIITSPSAGASSGYSTYNSNSNSRSFVHLESGGRVLQIDVFGTTYSGGTSAVKFSAAGSANAFLFNALVNVPSLNIASVAGGGPQMLITDNSGNVSAQAIPAGGTGTISSAGLTGSEFSFSNNPLISNGNIGISLATNAIAYGKIQQVGANKILGNSTGSTANVAEIGIGSGLSFSAGSLVNTFAPNGSAQNIQYKNSSGNFEGNSNFTFDPAFSKFQVNAKSYLGFTSTSSGSALVNIAPGSTSIAPLQLISGPVTTTLTNGNIEYDGTHIYGTVGSTRYILENQAALLTSGNITTALGYTPAPSTFTDSSHTGIISLTTQTIGSGDKDIAQNGPDATSSGTTVNSFRLGFRSTGFNTGHPVKYKWDIGAMTNTGPLFTMRLNGSDVYTFSGNGIFTATTQVSTPTCYTNQIYGQASNGLKLSGSVTAGVDLFFPAHTSNFSTEYVTISGSSFGDPTISVDGSNTNDNLQIAAKGTGKIIFTSPATFAQFTSSTRPSSPSSWMTIICTDCTANDSSTGVMQIYNGTTWKNAW